MTRMFRPHRVALALCCALAGPPCLLGACSNRLQDEQHGHIRRAQQLLQAGELKAAQAALEEVLSEGEDENARALLAVSHELARDYNRAAAEFERLAELRPRDAGAATHLGRTLALSGRDREARAALARARSLDKHTREAPLLLAALSDGQTDLSALSAALDKLRGPHSVERILVRAELAEVTGDEATARQTLARLDKAKLHNLSTAHALAELYKRRGRLQVVERLLTHLVAAAPEEPGQALDLAEVALSLNHLDVAHKALARIPKSADAPRRALVARARLAIAEGKPKAARDGLQAAIPKLTGVARDAARFQLAKVLLELGENAAVERELRQLLTADVGFVGAAMMLSDLLAGTGRADQVPGVLAPVIERHPDAGPLYARLGQAQLSLGQAEDAHATFTALADKTPDDPRAPYLVGTALQELGKRAEARAMFEASLAKKPGQAAPIAALVALLTADKKPDEARALLAQQIDSDPENPVLYRMLSDFHRERGEDERAEAALRRATEAAPEQADSWFQLGEFLSARERPEEAIATFKRGLEHDPNNAYGWNRVGDLAYLRGQHTEAGQAFERALALAPELARAQNNMAMLLAATGEDLARAEQLALSAQATAPEEPAVADTVGWIYHLRGKHDQALPLLERAAGALSSPASLYHLGAAYLAAGKTKEARKALMQALRKSDDFPGAPAARAKLEALK